MLKVASALNWSEFPFPKTRFPDPALVITAAPLNILFPALLSVVAPVLTAFTVPPKPHPLKYKEAAEALKSPPIAEAGPMVREVLPVSRRFTGTLPNWVNCFNCRYPVLKPAAPTDMVLPTARVPLALALHPNAIPWEAPVSVKIIFPLN